MIKKCAGSKSPNSVQRQMRRQFRRAPYLISAIGPPSLGRYHATSTTVQKSSMEVAGKDFIGASPILQCMATAPIINAAIRPAAGMITMGYHRPTKRRAAEISFSKPTPYIRPTGSPYAANSCFIFFEAAPRHAVGLSKRSNQTLNIPRATRTCRMILMVSIKKK